MWASNGRGSIKWEELADGPGEVLQQNKRQRIAFPRLRTTTIQPPRLLGAHVPLFYAFGRSNSLFLFSFLPPSCAPLLEDR